MDSKGDVKHFFGVRFAWHVPESCCCSSVSQLRLQGISCNGSACSRGQKIVVLWIPKVTWSTVSQLRLQGISCNGSACSRGQKIVVLWIPKVTWSTFSACVLLGMCPNPAAVRVFRNCASKGLSSLDIPPHGWARFAIWGFVLALDLAPGTCRLNLCSTLWALTFITRNRESCKAAPRAMMPDLCGLLTFAQLYSEIPVKRTAHAWWDTGLLNSPKTKMINGITLVAFPYLFLQVSLWRCNLETTDWIASQAFPLFEPQNSCTNSYSERLTGHRLCKDWFGYSAQHCQITVPEFILVFLGSLVEMGGPAILQIQGSAAWAVALKSGDAQGIWCWAYWTAWHAALP